MLFLIQVCYSIGWNYVFLPIFVEKKSVVHSSLICLIQEICYRKESLLVILSNSKTRKYFVTLKEYLLTDSKPTDSLELTKVLNLPIDSNRIIYFYILGKTVFNLNIELWSSSCYVEEKKNLKIQ
ncbi:MAG TPA: hypothetical protein PLI49_26815 [Leptospiraceae bacterium]|nr:hypothetical protein [Leptospiraceae bacterium]